MRHESLDGIRRHAAALQLSLHGLEIAPLHQGLALRKAVRQQEIVMMAVGIGRLRRDQEIHGNRLCPLVG